MGRKSQKFIDKRKDIVHSFKVVQRSQQDPLVADETAPQGVLIDTGCSDTHKDELNKYGVYFDDDYDYLQHLRGVKEAVDWEDCDVEVYTIKSQDPKINKISHKDIGLILPSSAFESYVEEPTGLLNKAAPLTGPRPELDPDIVAELDREEDIEGDLFGPEDEGALPDNFVSLLNSENDIEGFEDEGDDYSNVHNWLGDTQGYDEMPALEGSPNKYENFNEYRTARGITYLDSISENDTDDSDCDDFAVSDDEGDCNYDPDTLSRLPDLPSKRRTKSDAQSRTSVASSATVPRTELLQLLDARFERLYNDEFNDDEIGALDDKVIEGQFTVDSHVFKASLLATQKQFQKYGMCDVEGADKENTVHWIKNNYKYGAKEQLVEMPKEKPKLKYDCQSILSTYSNTKNLPKIIDDGNLPRNRKPRLTRKAIKEHNKEEGGSDSSSDGNATDAVTLLSMISAISNRPKDETPEERRERKNALKELRRERRKVKKMNKLCFKEELKQQKKVNLNKPKSRSVRID